MHKRLMVILVIGGLFSLIQLQTLAQDGAFADALNTTPTPTSSPLSIATSTPVPSITPIPASTTSTTTPVPAGDPVEVFYPPECAYVPGQPTSDECIAIIEADTGPNVSEINPDLNTLNRYSFWRVGPEAVAKYNAPGGAQTGTIGAGFNFINAIDSTVEGWLQIEGGEWIQRGNSYFVEPSYFTGVQLPENWNRPFGWVLDITGIYTSLYPGGESSAESGLIPLHYQRYNIFAEHEDEDGWLWYLIGPNQWYKQVFMSVIYPAQRPEGVWGHWVAVDLFEQSLVAYENDIPVFATLISTGLPGTETNEGVFEVWARLDRDAMSGATGAPNAYALQSVPWVLYFDDSISIHGTYWHDLFGYRRSRGCVNLSISDAHWVYEWTEDWLIESNQTEVATYVYVFSSGEYRDS